MSPKPFSDSISKLRVLDSPFRRLEVLDTEEQLWTLHFEGPEAKVWNSILRRTTLRVKKNSFFLYFSSELHFESDQFKSGTPFQGGPLSRTPFQGGPI
ncbi:hypothetical protein RclHR1_00990009 [Rhizophagus clarus]|uniref:Uncharacterized protein n=1 Tax=Rhizophagus clarus TaxID=94130 RepID=A0A2Z6S642_9GLOM|nr:hypothetical protein RclHR1_00990009 [Rhizophagus clarus]